jgi:hypothetical protein
MSKLTKGSKQNSQNQQMLHMSAGDWSCNFNTLNNSETVNFKHKYF